MSDFNLDPAVGSFLQGLQNAGLSDIQIGQLAQQQSNPSAWNQAYQGYIVGNALEQQRQQQELQRSQGDQKDALARIKNTLAMYGLDGLADWAWQQLQSGVSEDAIIVDMHNQQAYKARFPYEDAMRKAGLPVLSPAEMLTMERDYKSAQNRNGVPAVNDPNEYVDLFVHGVSANELDQRLTEYNKLRTVYAPHIKDAFEAHAGISGVSDEDLYRLMSGQDNKLSAQYAATTGAVLNLDFSTLQNAEQKAISEQQALFQQGGGEVRTNPESVESVVSRREAAF